MKPLVIAVLVSLGIVSCGCSNNNPKLGQAGRAKRLMALAAEETLSIDDIKDRLKRQLNIASMQVSGKQFRDGRKTLGHAWATIESDDDSSLDSHATLTGWISISELARAGEYPRFAKSACDEAIQLLRSIEPASNRCDFVRGVAMEVRKLEGNSASAELLRESSQWIAQIKDHSRRRQAYVAIASDLFGCGDDIGGKNVLRCDGDPKWRIEVLTMLAKEAVPLKAFGKGVSFESFYKNKNHKNKKK